MGKHSPSAIASGAGFAADIWIRIDKAVKKLGGTDLDIHRIGLDDFIERIAGLLMEGANRLLDFVGTVVVPAVERFVAADHFVVDTSGKRPVRIAFLGDNFKRHFLGKIEVGVAVANLRIHRLKVLSRDIPIITELGGEARAETALAHLFHLLSLQPNGGSGTLLTNGYANIFYVRDERKNLWAVYAFWSAADGGWNVFVFSIEHPNEWSVGNQVLSS